MTLPFLLWNSGAGLDSSKNSFVYDKEDKNIQVCQKTTLVTKFVQFNILYAFNLCVHKISEIWNAFLAILWNWLLLISKLSKLIMHKFKGISLSIIKFAPQLYIAFHNNSHVHHHHYHLCKRCGQSIDDSQAVTA